MSIGYNNMTLNDFSNYTDGTYTFHYNEERERVDVYMHEGVESYDEDYGGETDARECSAYLRQITHEGNGPTRMVDIETLIDSPKWILHRFPTGYVAIELGARLVRLALEPTHRRMMKGTTMQFMRGRAIVNSMDRTVPAEVRSALGPVCLNRTAGQVDAIERKIMLGMCDQLWLGHTPAFRQVHITDATERSKKAVRDMFAPFMRRKVMCVSPETAIIMASPGGAVAYVLHNGDLAGTLTCDRHKGILHLESEWLRGFSAGNIRAAAKTTYTDLFTSTFCDTIEWRM